MKILEEIGFTKRETELYMLLLRLGETSVSSIQKELGHHPQVVYRTVESLQKKGLVSVFRRKNRKYVAPENPEKLEHIERERLEALRRTLPDLKSLLLSKSDSTVTVGKGAESFRAMRMRAFSELKKSDTLYVIGASGDDYYEVMGELHDDIESKRIKKKIHKKLISFENMREKMRGEIGNKYTHVRFLDDSYPISSSTNIFGNTVVIVIWATDPIVISIKSEEVAQSYKQYFNQLWKVAEF